MATKEKPRKRQSSTRDRLLEVGVSLFASHGYYGTSIKKIVNAAKVNERMIYHYFGSKRKYYQTVLRQVYQSMEESALEAFTRCESVEEVVREGVRFYFDYHQKNPQFVSLVLRENLDHERLIDSPDFIVAKHPLLLQLELLIEADAKARRIRPDLNARYLVLSIIGSCWIYHSNRYTLSKSLRIDLGSRKVLQEGTAHVIETILHGIQPGTKAAPPPA